MARDYPKALPSTHADCDEGAIRARHEISASSRTFSLGNRRGGPLARPVWLFRCGSIVPSKRPSPPPRVSKLTANSPQI